MAHRGPDHSEADGTNRPAKRSRTDNPETFRNTDRSYRQRSPPPGGRGGSFYRPRDSRHPRRPTDSYRPTEGQHHQSRRSASPDRKPSTEKRARPKKKKSVRDRKENPSSRIHSLRKLLDRAALPATVQQEKERELAGLLFDQQQARITSEGKKNLKRYHFIRFVERQKATRVVKQLRKLQEAGNVSEQLVAQIHEAEVDLNYTLYAPLAHKYIAIYARDDSADGKARPLARNLSKMPSSDYARLSDDQRYAIETFSMEAANVLHLSNGEKPPMWYIVEAKMKEGQKALDNLRDEKLKKDHLNSDLVVGTGERKAPDWLTDDGVIDPQDLDSDSDESDGGVVAESHDDDDDAMSDGDGGFFEKS